MHRHGFRTSFSTVGKRPCKACVHINDGVRILSDRRGAKIPFHLFNHRRPSGTIDAMNFLSHRVRYALSGELFL
jgi:hypothetical protein